MDRTEEEYAQLIREFFQKYGSKLLVAVVIVAAFGGSWRLWHGLRSAKLDAAANLYYSVFKQQEETLSYMNAERAELPEVNLEDVTAVKSAYPDSLYAIFSSLYLARQHVLTEAFNEAVAELEWALEKASDPAIRDAIRGRIARINNQQGRTRSALAVLEGMETKASQAMADELRGDAWFLEGLTEDARIAYAKAAKAPPNSGQSAAIYWKLHEWQSAKTLTIAEAKARTNRRRFQIISSEPVPVPVPETKTVDDVTPDDASDTTPAEVLDDQ